jgi:ABC-type amino acid transport system permease subunit
MSTVPSARQRLFLAALAFLFVLIVSFVTDLVGVRYPSWMIVDDLTLAVVAALVVYRYERERSRFFSERLRVIREMNAFVRNELQILYASLAGSEKARIQAVERGVERIDWALRELLPGGRPSPISTVEEISSRSEKSA